MCESKLGFAHCSCLSRYILSADGKSCLPADASNGTTGDLFKVMLLEWIVQIFKSLVI